MAKWHVSPEDGVARKCTASVQICKFNHADNEANAYKLNEDMMAAEGAEAFSTIEKRNTLQNNEFSDRSYYGKVKPRNIQPEPLNAVIQALDEDDATQLVAACGTGKSYMGRQLMAHSMGKDDANGVSIMLTSSIKLASATAADLRPDENGKYDQALGTLNEDYVVIEVHSDSKEFVKNGSVSTDKIKKAWNNALAEGKKVVVVSTYESSSKVQEVQEALLEDGVNARADLLMNDEAHNILGQQRSQSASTEGVNTGYRSFHDEIPGAIQSSKRLYATATPVVIEAISDAPSAVNKTADDDERVLAMQKQANLMSKDPKARITIYSDDETIVGKVSGYISQETAVEEKYLSKPDYQIRAAQVSGDSTHQYVNIEGVYTSSSEFSHASEKPMTPQTYAAVTSTLSAMTADAEEGKNPSHNALAYCGSIEQAKAYRDNIKKVALANSGGLSIAQAESLVNSQDETLKAQARMRLLAEHAQVSAAYSGDDPEAKAARAKAFGMFKGNAVTTETGDAWSPHKKVLANVDIFSEGVSISEIDTVVISDDAKTSERAMTQAIGRSIRVVPNNDYKNTGHVIIPQVLDEKGNEVNGGSVAIATYGATRVERGVAANKLRGNAPIKDEHTFIKKYDTRGRLVGSELASDLSAKHLTSTSDVVAAHNIERAHQALLTSGRKQDDKDPGKYQNLSQREQYARVSSFISTQASSTKNNDASWAVTEGHLKGKNSHEMNSIRQSNKVLLSSLGAGDTGSLDKKLASDLVKVGILKEKGSDKKNELTLEDKRAILNEYTPTITRSIMDPGVEKTHPELFAAVTSKVDKKTLNDAYKKGHNIPQRKAAETFQATLDKDPVIAEQAFDYIQRARKTTTKKSTIHDTDAGVALKTAVDSAYSDTANETASKALGGETMLEVNTDLVQANGLLRVDALKKLS